MSSVAVSGLQTLSCLSLPGIMKELLLTDEDLKHRAAEKLSKLPRVPRAEAPLRPAPGSLPGHSVSLYFPLKASFDADRKLS